MKLRLLIALVLCFFAIEQSWCGPESDPPGVPERRPLHVKAGEGKDPSDPQLHLLGPQPMLYWDPLYMWVPGEAGVELQPQLAEDWPEYSDDGLTCTVRIRKGAAFEDINTRDPAERSYPVTAHDIVTTIKRALKYREFNASALLLEMIEGADAMPVATRTEGDLFWTANDDDVQIPGVRVIDDRTLEFKLTHPTRMLPVVLAHPNFCVIRRRFILADKVHLDDRARHHTTGPLAASRLDVETLSWREDREHDAGRQQLQISRGSQGYMEARRALADGVCDYIHRVSVPGGLSPDELDPEFRPYPLEVFYFIAFNMDDETWGGFSDDARALRKSVRSALDRRAFVDAWQSETLSEVQTCTDIMPRRRGMPVLFTGELETASDADAANQHLEGTKFEERSDISLRVAVHKGFRLQELEPLTAPLAELGVRIEFDRLSTEEFRESAGKDEHDAWIMGWWNESPDPAIFLRVFHSRHREAAAASSLFAGHYRSDAYDDLYERLETLAPDDKDARDARLAELVDRIRQDCAYIPLAELWSFDAISPQAKLPDMPVSSGSQLRFLRR